MKLPFYNVLTPAIRHYLAERIQVESYLPMEKISIGESHNLDFLYIESGCIELFLENVIGSNLLQQKPPSNFSTVNPLSGGSRAGATHHYYILK